MASVKINADGVNRRANQIAERRNRIERLEKLGRVRDYPEWDVFASLLKDGIETRKRILTGIIDGERNYDDAESLRIAIRENRSIRDTLEGVVLLIKDPTVEIERLKSEISQFETEIKEAQAYSGGD